MELAKSYITDKDGSISDVVVDIATFRKIEELLLDRGLADEMKNIEDEAVLSPEAAQAMLTSVE